MSYASFSFETFFELLDLMSSTLAALKARNESRVSDEKRVIDRNRNIMVMILNHLSTHNYMEALKKLESESGITLNKFTVADNIDLPLVMAVCSTSVFAASCWIYCCICVESLK